ncbi:hypothetical protein [Undibacterium sp. Di24W]|uniref:hypothetical protein n=1 Tax=Undibacterium sp. Di24W TaxID=3413033 RepID=UPI003BF14D29
MTLQKIYLKSLILFAMLCSLMNLASAQRDEGQYQILHARYGTAERNVDVTQTLKDLARRDVNFRMGNDSFGVDPHPNRVKTLRIYARSERGETRTFEYREDSLVDGALFTGWGGGNWGRDGDYRGGWDNRDSHGNDRADRDDRDDGEFQILRALYGTAERNVDVTDRLKELARSDRNFRMGNRSFGIDPHPNRVKTLRIYARGARGEIRTFEYSEGSLVDGAMFKSWGRGNWGNRGDHQGGWGDGDDRNYDNRNDNQDRYAESRQLIIISAYYGIESRKTDVSRQLRSLINNGRLELRVENNILGGDPAPDVAKSLWVTYSINGGRTQTVRVEERAWLNLR